MHRSAILVTLLAAVSALAACPDDGRAGDGDGNREAAAASGAGGGGASGGAEQAAQRPEDVHRLGALAEAPRFTDDLEGLKQRGVLRVLVAGTEEDFLPRRGMPASEDRRLARAFAAREGLEVEFILVPDYDDLLPLLKAGVGDVVAASLTETEARAAEVAFTAPLNTVSEWVVAAKDAVDPPRKPEDLAGREVHVRASSSYAETLRALSAEKAPGLKIVPVPEHLDAESIVYEVTRGKRPLTVVDSHLLDAIEAYNRDVQRLFPIAEGRKVAWAVRRESPALEGALDAFLMEEALTAHTRERFAGDLEGIRRRGVLRVLTRNSSITYFLHKGRPRGFEYELARMLAEDLGVRLEMVVPPRREDLIPWLLEGKGDVVAAGLTVTDRRKAKVAFSRPYLYVEEVLVEPKQAEDPPKALTDLAGRAVAARPSSSYWDTLTELKQEVGLKLVKADERMETEAVLAAVADGRFPLTVADSHIVKAELTWRDDIAVAFPLTASANGSAGEGGGTRAGGGAGGSAGGSAGGGEDASDWRDLNAGTKHLALAVRPDAPALLARVDAFLDRIYRGVEFNVARRRYFESPRHIARAKTERVGVSGRLSRWDELIKRYSRRYDFDWRLMAALAYQESRFDPRAKSWVGAQGLFQVMPSTGAAMGFTDLTRPAQGIHAGIRYLHRMMERLDPTIPFDERVRFAMAAYNAGLGHVEDARRLAAERGLDPDRWFDNVEKAMLLLEQPRYHRQARFGYVRGSEPVRYVREIQNRYDNWVKIVR